MLRLLLSWLLVCLLALATSGAWAQPGPAKNPDPDTPWRQMTPEQRESRWRQMTPEQKVEAWNRLTPEQRQAMRQRMTPEQREAIRQRWQERRDSGDGPGRRLSPEERRQLRDQVYESNRARPPHSGGKNR
jgi:cell division protein FtsN